MHRAATKLRDLAVRAVWRVAPSHLHALRSVSASPAPWDVAALQLDEARRSQRDPLAYPQYLYGLLSAARTAQAVGVSEFVAIEFGVAGGNGLVALEDHADWVTRVTGVRVRVMGFDAGAGLPAPRDPRDSPFSFSGGEFAMDVDRLKARLRSADLRIGDVQGRCLIS